jgi:hypothetical protein
VAAVLLAVAATLTGCTVVSSLVDTQQGLQRNGYQSVSVKYKFNNDSNGVSVSVSVDAPATQTDVQNVAQVVWQDLHERFDFLEVTVHGTGGGAGAVQRATFTFADLQSLFGPRNPSWNKTTITGSLEHLGLAVLIGIVVVIAAIVAIVVSIRRRNRRRRPPWVGGGGTGMPMWPAPPGPPWAPWTPGAPPPGPPPGSGWSPPPPPPGSGWSPGQPAPPPSPPPPPPGVG